MIRGKTRMAQLIMRFKCVWKIAVGVQTREAIHDIFRQIQCFTCFTHRASAAKSNDIGRHSRTKSSVTLVDFLDDLLTAIAARQIQIDVRPTLSAFTQKAFKQ